MEITLTIGYHTQSINSTLPSLRSLGFWLRLLFGFWLRFWLGFWLRFSWFPSAGLPLLLGSGLHVFKEVVF